jgi:hypothetical protein
MLTIRGSITDTGVVSLRLPIDETTPGNANPIITGVSVVSPEPVRLLDDTGLVTVPRDKKVKLRAGIDQTQAELYLDRQLGPDDEYQKDSAGQFILGPTTERLTVFWFSEGGGFVDRTARAGAPKISTAMDSPSPSRPPSRTIGPPRRVADYAATTSLVLVVVQDSRGGVAWTHDTATLEAAP